MIGFGEAVRQFYGNYVNADGRAQRSAYWWAVLYQLIINVVLVIVVFMAEGGEHLFEVIDSMIGGNADATLEEDFYLGPSGIAALVVMGVFWLVNFLPDIMLRIRRFHDLGQSGWLVLAFFCMGALPPIAIFSALGNIIWFIFPGTNGSNQYGQDPLR